MMRRKIIVFISGILLLAGTCSLAQSGFSQREPSRSAAETSGEKSISTDRKNTPQPELKKTDEKPSQNTNSSRQSMPAQKSELKREDSSEKKSDNNPE